ncbi:MAG: flagellar biosynthesis protein FlgN [Spirochaetaceae bacterium]
MEYTERLALLHRLRDMLTEQRSKFQQYLDILDKQEAAIRARDVEALYEYAELETSVLEEIQAFGKVIRPLQSLYRSAYPQGEQVIPPLRDSLGRLREQVLARNRHNRALLRERIEELKGEMQQARTPAPRRSLYAPAASGLVDITT